jgi:hypothetical protein
LFHGSFLIRTNLVEILGLEILVCVTVPGLRREGKSLCGPEIDNYILTVFQQVF